MTKIGHIINTGNFETVNAHAAYLFHFYGGTFNILETDEKGTEKQPKCH